MVELYRTPAGQLKHRIQSFVRREGRLTPAQRRALQQLWPIYGLLIDMPLEVGKVFPKSAPLIVDIGFGDGESLLQMASSHPQYNYLGIEVHRPGIGHLLMMLERLKIANVRVYCADAVDVLGTLIEDEVIQRVNVFFPDPWPKKRHHKRRLIQPEFVNLVARKLEFGGTLHLATDWPNYARSMRTAVTHSPLLRPIDNDSLVPSRPTTKYERRGRRLGHPVTDLAYSKET